MTSSFSVLGEDNWHVLPLHSHLLHVKRRLRLHEQRSQLLHTPCLVNDRLVLDSLGCGVTAFSSTGSARVREGVTVRV